MRLTPLVRAAASAVPRGNFTRLTSNDLAEFERIVGDDHVRTTEIENYATDWTRQMRGSPAAVLLPESTEEVSALLRHCAKRGIAVVPQGGRTGLVGGATPVHDEVVLAVDRIKSHFHLEKEAGILSLDAGWILEEADTKIAPDGYMMPLDLGAKGSCQIGGCLAAGAGGIRLLRYGSLHSHLLGVTMVDGAGRVLELGGRLRKDNTALHAAQLAIGSEGQLGVITRATMSVVPRPSSILSAMLAVTRYEQCLAILSLARRKLGEVLSSFELIDAESMRACSDNLQLKNVLDGKHPFYLLVETHGSNSGHDGEKLMAFVEEALGAELAVDGIVAQNETERNYMWRLREETPIACMKDGYIYKYDVSLPHQHYYALTEETRKMVGDRAKVYCYGHLGDGNSHLNVTTPAEDPYIKENLSPWVYKWVVDHGGSISAEHGIGQLKRDYRHLGKSREEQELMRSLKGVFDPAGILSPYKMIPAKP